MLETWEWNASQLAGALPLEIAQPDVWLVDLDAAFVDQPAAMFLSPDEIQRASRYRFEIHRRRFIARRAWLRLLLSRYLGCSPLDIQFVANPYGKLSLVSSHLVEGSGDPAGADPAAPPMHFNLSHSNNLALYAFALDQEIGVDIEYVLRDFGQPVGSQPEYESIALRFFSPAERAALMALPVPQRRQAFFNCWTRKEAYIKAYGLGLSLPLDEFDVTLAPGEPARLLAAHHAGSSSQRCTLAHLEPAPDYVGALAVMGEITRLNCRVIVVS